MQSEAIDIVTTIGSIVGFLSFFVAHVVVFRRIKERDAVRWFFVLVVVVGSILGVAETQVLNLLPIEFSLLSVMLFVILASCYFMGVFGLLATSVRIRILCEIARSGKKGMTFKQLLTRYNREVIVNQRLARLVSNGDIVYSLGKYSARSGVTFFVFPALVLRSMKFLYG